MHISNVLLYGKQPSVGQPLLYWANVNRSYVIDLGDVQTFLYFPVVI